MSAVLEMAIVLISAIIGFVIIIRTLLGNRYQKELWRTFSKVAQKFDLRVIHSSNIVSNYPDIYGQIDNRKIYLHPAKKKRGRKSRPAKTVFGVEHGIRIEDNVLITRKSTETKNDNLMDLHVDKLKKYKLKVQSGSKLNENVIDDMIDNEVARKINDLIEESGDNFRALIIESGLLMFSTFGFEEEEDVIDEYIEKLYEITVKMEENLGEVEDVYNERFVQLDQRNYAIPIKYGIDISLILIGAYLIYSSFSDLSFIFLNIGVVIVLVALVRIYSLSSLLFISRR